MEGPYSLIVFFPLDSRAAGSMMPILYKQAVSKCLRKIVHLRLNSQLVCRKPQLLHPESYP